MQTCMCFIIVLCVKKSFNLPFVYVKLSKSDQILLTCKKVYDNIIIYFFSGGLPMYSKEVTVTNSVGLHARPATFFIQKSNEFKSSIWVEKSDRRINAKSLLGILSLGIIKGTRIKVIADGVDEEAAVSSLINLIENELAD